MNTTQQTALQTALQTADTIPCDVAPDVLLAVDVDTCGKETTFNLGPSIEWLEDRHSDNYQSQEVAAC